MDVSIVSPIYNEEANLTELCRRIGAVLDQIEKERGLRGEILLVDDGSSDGSRGMIRRLSGADPRIRVHTFGRNRGQFVALLTGLAMTDADYVITLDADLQNPPEEIPRLLDALQSGHDLVVTRRARRRDSRFRRIASCISNRVSSWIAGSVVLDHGCMMCGYRRSLVQAMCAHQGEITFIRALALRWARDPVGLTVAHAPRLHGTSRYSLARLVKLQLDAIRSFLLMRRQRRRTGPRGRMTSSPESRRAQAVDASTEN